MDKTKELEAIPLYKALFKRKPARVFEGLPQLEKRDIVDGFPTNWMTSNLRKGLESDALEFTTTSGSTSDRMQIMRRKGWWKHEYERTYACHPLLKKSLQAKKAILTTAICSNTACYRDDPSLKQRTVGNTLYLNIASDPNSWTKADIQRMIDELALVRPVYLDADPVYLALFLKLKEAYGIRGKLHAPEVLTLSYEFVSACTRRYIERFFHCEILNLYGTTEFGYLFLENARGNMQLCPAMAGVGFDPIDRRKGIYALIVHSEKNEYMPLFNYRVGDLVEIAADRLKPGSKIVEVKRICGREKDLLAGADGHPVTTAEVDDLIANLGGVIQYQLCLTRNGGGRLRYVTDDDSSLTARQAKLVMSGLQALLGSSVSLSKERAIAPEASGKFALIKQF